MIGTGTQQDPFIIQTADDFNNIRNNLTAYYELGNNIDYGNKDFRSIGSSTTSQRFRAKIDGRGFTVSNVKIINGTNYDMGLFGYLDTDFELRNIKLLNIIVDSTGSSASTSAFSLISSNTLGIFENIHLQGTLIARGQITRVGAFGALGYETIDRLKMRNIYTEVDIRLINATPRSTNAYVGGLFGSIVNDQSPSVSPNFTDILVNNRYTFTNTNTGNFTIGRVVGMRNYETTYPRTYVNTSHSFSNYVENFGILTDSTIRQPVNLDPLKWVQGKGEIPQLRVFVTATGNQGKRTANINFNKVSIRIESSKSKSSIFVTPFDRIVLNLSKRLHTTSNININNVVVEVEISDKKSITHILNIPFEPLVLNVRKVNTSCKIPSVLLETFKVLLDISYPIGTIKPIYACVYIQNGCSTVYTVTSCNQTHIKSSCTGIGVI